MRCVVKNGNGGARGSRRGGKGGDGGNGVRAGEVCGRRAERGAERGEWEWVRCVWGSGGVLGRRGRKEKFERVICLSVP